MVFEFRRHTADIELVAEAKELEEVFSEVARALAGILTEHEIAASASIPVELTSESLESLLFDFIDEMIFLLDTQGFVASRLECEIFSDGQSWVLDGIVYGDDISSYEHHGDLKAPTYHKLSISEVESGWRATAVIDL